MANLDTVRLIIADPPLFARAETTGDGVKTQFSLPHAPIIGSTVLAWVDGVLTAPSAVEEKAGIVTFAVAPGDGLPVIITYRWCVLLDADIEAFLTLEGDSVKLAAAQALDTIASSEVMIQKRITLLDLQTDGPATAKELRAHAKALRDQVADTVTDEDAEGLIDYAEMVLPPFDYHAIGEYRKEWEELNS